MRNHHSEKARHNENGEETFAYNLCTFLLIAYIYIYIYIYIHIYIYMYIYTYIYVCVYSVIRQANIQKGRKIILGNIYTLRVTWHVQ